MIKNNENTIKMSSINIEGDKHLDTVIRFLQENSPEVICLQEVFEKDFPAINKVLLSMVIIKYNNRFTLGTTHFTLSEDGKADENQRRDLEKLLTILNDFEELILCGDFNAPRGEEIFSKISSRYKDNIPLEYETSLDSNLHRAKGLKLMIDGLFTTPHYQAGNVRLIEGVSDHCAITAKISRSS